MIELAWASNKTVKVAMKLDAWELIWNAGPVVKFVMIVLAGFSVVSWAIIFTKHTQLSKVTAENASFLDLFWKASSLENINAEVGRFKMSPLANVFRAGYSELQRIAESRLGEKSSSGALSLSGIENVSRALRKASDSEVAKIEGRTGFLATVGSTSPFIGLFGTVWGIMNSFQNIGNTGAASLSVVAPGISEALIATAIGLATAIPAVMAYNYFVGKFKKQDLEINNFTADFLNIVKRNFFKD